MPVAVEVASSKHVENALEFGIDVLWIGARTTVNPFSVQDIADALRGVDIPVFVKNPMNPDVELWQGAVQRLQAVGIGNIGLIHRGFSTFGASSYRNNPMWHIPIEMHRRAEFKQALEQLRGQIDHLDAELLAVLSRRMSVAEKIGMIKKENNVTILQTSRWGEILEKVKRQSQLLNLSEEFLGKILEAIHVESINRQNRVMNDGI